MTSLSRLGHALMTGVFIAVPVLMFLMPPSIRVYENAMAEWRDHESDKQAQATLDDIDRKLVQSRIARGLPLPE